MNRTPAAIALVLLVGCRHDFEVAQTGHGEALGATAPNAWSEGGFPIPTMGGFDVPGIAFAAGGRPPAVLNLHIELGDDFLTPLAYRVYLQTDESPVWGTSPDGDAPYPFPLERYPERFDGSFGPVQPNWIEIGRFDSLGVLGETFTLNLDPLPFAALIDAGETRFNLSFVNDGILVGRTLAHVELRSFSLPAPPP